MSDHFKNYLREITVPFLCQSFAGVNTVAAVFSVEFLRATCSVIAARRKCEIVTECKLKFKALK